MKSKKKLRIPLKGEGGLRETIIAFVICALLLLVPMIYIEYEYKLFTQTHGKALEGAAGAGLALAVVFRTVSRTVLRTIIRTSARAGMRASLKGALRAGIRAASRAHSKGLLKKEIEEQEEKSIKEQRTANVKSLCFASCLLFFSWVIVVGFGQPFGRLMDEESTKLHQQMVEEKEVEREQKAKNKAYTSFEKREELEEEREELRKLQKELKMERDVDTQKRIEAHIKTQKGVVSHAKAELLEALHASNNKELNPEAPVESFEESEGVSNLIQWLYTYAPFPGEPKVGENITLVFEGLHDVKGNAINTFKLNYKIGPSKASKSKSQKNNISINKLLKITPEPMLNGVGGEWSWVLLKDGVELEFDQSIEDYSRIYVEGGGRVRAGVPEFKGKILLIPLFGRTSWSSLVIWLGGLAIVIPLWVMYFAQIFVARREKVLLRHETGPIGGAIQLYFAGAFSFMPLTSDVIVDDASPKVRSKIALVGILVPCLFSVLLWYCWKITGFRWVLFTADAFLIYPMVQCFPLAPLEGIYIWRYRKIGWIFTFILVMGLFMFMASEGLRNVI